MVKTPNAYTVLILAGALLSAVACKREERALRAAPTTANFLNTVQVSGLRPGGVQIEPPEAPPAYNESAYALSEGQKMFESFNCVGCHAHGDGGIGPPLMDNQWVYGSEPANIANTIMQGRPNGMPPFRGKIPEEQVWEIAAYVRSLSGLVPKDVAPNRTDHLTPHESESSTPYQQPTGITGAGDDNQ